MHRDQLRKTITSQFYQSLAESGVEISALPQAQLQALVNAMADSLMASLAAVDDEAASASPAASPAEAAEDAEVPIWSGRPYLSIGTRYELTSQRLRIIQGLLGRSFEEIELVRVRDTSISQHVGERTLNVGDITVISNDPQHPEVVLHNVREPLAVRELIRKATMAEKKRRGLAYREEM